MSRRITLTLTEAEFGVMVENHMGTPLYARWKRAWEDGEEVERPMDPMDLMRVVDLVRRADYLSKRACRALVNSAALLGFCEAVPAHGPVPEVPEELTVWHLIQIGQANILRAPNCSRATLHQIQDLLYYEVSLLIPPGCTMDGFQLLQEARKKTRAS